MVLSDDNSIDADRRATKENILRWMDWLVVGAKATDLLFFHCAFILSLSSPSIFGSQVLILTYEILDNAVSGHGIQVKDTNGDESLGYDDGMSSSKHQ